MNFVFLGYVSMYQVVPKVAELKELVPKVGSRFDGLGRKALAENVHRH